MEKKEKETQLDDCQKRRRRRKHKDRRLDRREIEDNKPWGWCPCVWGLLSAGCPSLLLDPRLHSQALGPPLGSMPAVPGAVQARRNMAYAQADPLSAC